MSTDTDRLVAVTARLAQAAKMLADAQRALSAAQAEYDALRPNNPAVPAQPEDSAMTKTLRRFLGGTMKTREALFATLFVLGSKTPSDAAVAMRFYGFKGLNPDPDTAREAVRVMGNRLADEGAGITKDANGILGLDAGGRTQAKEWLEGSAASEP